MHLSKDGWLVAEEGDQPLVVLPSVRATKLTMKVPRAVIWHWSGPIEHAQQEVERIQTYDPNTDKPRSWHILIAKDGTIYQSLSLITAGWHMQKGGMIGMNYYRALNKATVAIVLENEGRLKCVDGVFRPIASKSKLGAPIEVAETVPWNNSHYVPYTEAQKKSAVQLMHTLMQAFKWKTDAFNYGHRSFEYAKHDDPGPLWMQEVLPELFRQLGSKG